MSNIDPCTWRREWIFVIFLQGLINNMKGIFKRVSQLPAAFLISFPPNLGGKILPTAAVPSIPPAIPFLFFSTLPKTAKQRKTGFLFCPNILKPKLGLALLFGIFYILKSLLLSNCTLKFSF